MQKFFPHIAISILLITCLAFIWTQTRIAGSDDFLMGAAITSIDGTDTLKDSRAVINTNFANLNTFKLENSDFTGGTGITYTATGTFSFDCSEVEGTGINCAGEAITLDATGDWTGTLDSLEGAAFFQLSTWYATTTHALISSLPSLSITESQISDLSSYITQVYASSTFVIDGCTDCLNATEIEDIYVLNTGDIISGTIDLKDAVGDSPSLGFYESTGLNSMSLYYDNGNSRGSISANGGLRLFTSGTLTINTSNDTDDYITISTDSNVPIINGVGANIKITADGGTVDFDNENLTTTGNVNYTNKVAQFHSATTTDIATTSWTNIPWDTLIADETTSGYATTSSDTIKVDFDGILRVQGCAHFKNNKGSSLSTKVALRVLVNSDEARCLQYSENFTKEDGAYITFPLIGTIAVSANDEISVQYKVGDIAVDLEGDDVFDNPVAASVNFERISR